MQLIDRFYKARKAIISEDFSNLNSMQQQAVLTTEGPLLLLAGAGSGKTTVLISRIANLIKYGKGSDTALIPPSLDEHDVLLMEQYLSTHDETLRTRAQQLCAMDPAAPWSIIAITFTNKAANELKDRLENMLGSSGRDVWASTFHSACVRILRRDIGKLGFESSFTIYDTSDSERVIKDIIKDFNLNDKIFTPKSVASGISRAKDAMNPPREYLAFAEKTGDIYAQSIGKCYVEYQNRLKRNNALDFDDIIYYTVKLLSENENIRSYYQRKFRYVLIHEYQETNKMQYMLAKLLTGDNGNICVVGDDDQSIYRFRGATIENILNFEDEYKNAKVIRLEQNYRSTGTILEAANAVIKNNTGRKGKHLWTENSNGSLITLYNAMDENDEAQYVANTILKGYASTKKWSDFAVLYRMNAQSNQLEFAFKRNGIPYRVVGGMRFFDRAEIKDVLSYLCVINNRNDDVRMRRIINLPARGIGAKTLETAQQLALDRGCSIFDIAANASNFISLQKSASKLKAFTDMIDSLADESSKMDLPDFYDLVLDKTGYLAMLTTKNDPESRNRAENVGELKSSIVNYVQNAQENGLDASLSGFLDEVALYTDLENLDQDSDSVVMMTIHSAKGLEFPTVFLVGAEDGVFPSLRTIGNSEETEEERRLCYVAITRAKKELYITHTKHRMLFGRTTANKLSRFIEEIPDSLLNRTQAFTGMKSVSQGSQRITTPRRTYQSSTAPIGGGYSKSPSTVKPAAALQLSVGDSIQHTAFGKGFVLSLQKMGNDALIEIAFDNVGTKRLMLNTAGKHIKKL